MNGPALPISVLDYFDIDVALIYEYGNRLLGDEIISGKIYWNMFPCEYYTPWFEVVRGLFDESSASVLFRKSSDDSIDIKPG
ncbi:hypothetical protein L1049_008000 [Liquidambar formosana]|uniref:Uncharacterized protein n=1 Tax=Liquidambar formosana TaxID=63359 RepID=A0AAP0X8V2_LIQFO